MRALIIALAYALLSACGSQAPPIEIEEAWSPPTPPGAVAAAVYMEITAREADVLLSATTPIAERAELHTTVNAEGMMQMRPLERAPLAPGAAVRFEPGGQHFMLMNLRTAPASGSEFPMTLQFERAGAITVAVKVRAHDEDAG